MAGHSSSHKPPIFCPTPANYFISYPCRNKPSRRCIRAENALQRHTLKENQSLRFNSSFYCFFFVLLVISEFICIFAAEFIRSLIMTQIVLNIEDASLIPSLKKILGSIKGVTIDKLVTPSKDAEAEKAFITETISKGFREAKEGRFAGKNLKSLDALVEELRAEA
jgi:hypothetical protein